MSTISVAEIEHDPAGWLRRLKAGEPFIVVEGGRTVAQVTPAPPPLLDPRPFGLAAGQFTVPDDFDAPLPDDILEAFNNPQ